MILSLIGYDPIGVWTKTMENAEELTVWKNPAGITWIDVEGLAQTDQVNRLADIFGIHPLTVEDILDSTHQRPKAEEFDHYLFIAFKPELGFAPSYFIVWGVMLVIALGMLLFFKRRKWI